MDSSSSEKDSIELLKSEINTLRKELKLKNEQCQIKVQLIEEHQTLLKELEDFKIKFKKYQVETNDCKSKYEKEIQKFKATTKELKEKWSKDYENKCISTMKKNAQLEAEKKMIQSQLSTKTKELTQLEKEFEKEKKLNQEEQESTKKELSVLRKKSFELQLENEQLKSSINENQKEINAINKEELNILRLKNEQQDKELKEIRKERDDLKRQLDFLKSKNDASSSSKPSNIDQDFTIQKLEADSRFINYYNKREKRLSLIEEAFKEKDKPEARKLFIYQQIQERLLEDEFKEKIQSQEDKINLLNEEIKSYNEIQKKIDSISQKAKNKKENPFVEELETISQENISLREQYEMLKVAYSKFTKAAFKVFSIYKSGFEEIYKMLKEYQTAYKSIIEDSDDISLRINIHHPLISFYKKLSKFTIFCPNDNKNE